MLITLIFSVLGEHSAVNISTVTNIDSTKLHLSQINNFINQAQLDHSDAHHTVENKDDCCDVDCCESNCICIGYGTANDCFDMTRIPTSAPGLSDAINLCLKDADISQEHIEYINLHGTATKLNDIAETNAINRIFTLSPNVSGFKGYTDHMLGACGAFEVAITLYSMAQSEMPHTLGLKSVANNCQLNHILHSPLKSSIKHAISVNCGMGGVNTAIQISKLDY